MTLADAAFTETECTFAQALHLFHHPQVLVLELFGKENRELAAAAVRKVDIETLGIERNLINAGLGMAGGCDTDVNGRLPQ